MACNVCGIHRLVDGGYVYHWPSDVHGQGGHYSSYYDEDGAFLYTTAPWQVAPSDKSLSDEEMAASKLPRTTFTGLYAQYRKDEREWVELLDPEKKCKSFDLPRYILAGFMVDGELTFIPARLLEGAADLYAAYKEAYKEHYS